MAAKKGGKARSVGSSGSVGAARKRKRTGKVGKVGRVAQVRKVVRKRHKAETLAAPLGKSARLDRERRTLEDARIPTPPSSLDMDRRGTAARTGRAEMLDEREKHGDMNSVTAGDVDVNAEDAYFTGEEAPGGDNPTPDQDVVDDIGKALGVQYQDDEELRGADKLEGRDKHRWELDPASSEDYKGRK